MKLSSRVCRGVALSAALCGAWLLAGCARTPQPVHFFAAGRPEHLSEWQVLIREAGRRDGRLVPNAQVVPYDLNTPLFSDYAHKFRTVWMPPGTAAKYSDAQSFEFPVGTIITKTFFYPRAGGDSTAAVMRTYDQSRDFAGPGLDLAHVRLIETRLLVRRDAGWVALPYVWNAEQTDAVLARTGDEMALELLDADGKSEAFTYVVPNENQCAGCHVTDLKTKAIAPIGPKARHLNRNYPYPGGEQNQLSYLQKVGYLTGVPPLAEVPRNAGWRDASQPLDARARAYLDVNCGHCHNPKGPADTTSLFFDVGTPADRHLGLCKPPVAAGRGTGDHMYDIVPGHPDDSILPFRMASREPGVMMPEQGRGTVHREGLALIRDWIAALPGECGA
ncbi:MAG TPA: SO2930 family diheme c-type cytochrome [Steroidobacteraceae bacterium]|nr:SO2930 family diheme c-type cytochrome [Steroidobacteraceae bacterium]